MGIGLKAREEKRGKPRKESEHERPTSPHCDKHHGAAADERVLSFFLCACPSACHACLIPY